MEIKRPRILFVAEATTLAHISRPLVLARSLDPMRYEVHFASANRYEFIFKDTHFQRWPINSLPTEHFLAAIKAGRPLFDYSTLAGYVEADLTLLEAVQPDLVIGDLRFSLSVSARKFGVPHFALMNAYWSPYARPRYIVPEHVSVNILGPVLANLGFQAVRPLIFLAHTVPLNRVRRRYGLPLLSSLQAVYTAADRTLYADVPELIPTFNLPTHHHYIGPVLWSPQTVLPTWWDTLPTTRTNVYVTPGSSGDSDFLPLVTEACRTLPVNALIATAGRSQLVDPPENAYVADFLPGTETAARSRLVICNGGSPTAAQALVNGVPVLGIATNMDQYLNMAFVEDFGAGRILRSDQANVTNLRHTIAAMLNQPRYHERAAHVQRAMQAYDAPSNVSELIDLELTNGSGRRL